ncbi:superinfection immunity protein [Streptomyces sp. NPDC001904]|uniref:superinfection immunity protein n=1 Tax=Streptomyces sp. NPDC001904 TaxID=3154531 RepID=UPI003330D7BE
MFSGIGPIEFLLSAVVLAAALAILFVPSMIAYRRRIERLWLVIVVNVLAGWTGVLWFVALWMALRMRTRTVSAPPAAVPTL